MIFDILLIALASYIGTGIVVVAVVSAGDMFTKRVKFISDQEQYKAIPPIVSSIQSKLLLVIIWLPIAIWILTDMWYESKIDRHWKKKHES